MVKIVKKIDNTINLFGAIDGFIFDSKRVWQNEIEQQNSILYPNWGLRNRDLNRAGGSNMCPVRK